MDLTISAREERPVRKGIWALGGLLLLGLGVLLALGFILEPRSGPGTGGSAAVGAADGRPGHAAGSDEWLEVPASEVAFETLEGGEESLLAYRGRTVLLNFWGTWCPPCRREIPELVEVQEAFPAGEVVVIGVAVDSGTPEEIRAFLEEYGVEYPIWLSGGGKALANFQAAGYPFTLLIDEDGRIRREYLGPQSADRLTGDIRALRELRG